MAALLDDDAHARAIRKEARKRKTSEPQPGSDG
jgi:hypothetical protein